MSAAMVRRFVASAPVFVLRKMQCGHFEAVKPSERRLSCAECLRDAREAAKKLKAADRAAKSCRGCRTPLLDPSLGEFCGLCDPGWDVAAGLARVDAESRQ